MINLYTLEMPNGRKVSILLEEIGLRYSVFPIDITAGEQLVEAVVGQAILNGVSVRLRPREPRTAVTCQ